MIVSETELHQSNGNQTLEKSRISSLISVVLERSIQKNESLFKASRKKKMVMKKQEISIFHGTKAPPNMSIRQYINRIFKYTSCSSCFVLAYVYIDRFLQRSGSYLTSLNIHRLLITSVMVAAKFIGDDRGNNNAYFANVGGITTAEINKQEMNFLFTLDFRLYVSAEVFNEYLLLLEEEVFTANPKNLLDQSCQLERNPRQNAATHSRASHIMR